MLFSVTLFAVGLFLLWAAFIAWAKFDWIDMHLLGGRWTRLRPHEPKTANRDPFRRNNARRAAAMMYGTQFLQARLQLPMVFGVADSLALAFAVQRILD